MVAFTTSFNLHCLQQVALQTIYVQFVFTFFTIALTCRLLCCNKYLLPEISGLSSSQQSNTSNSLFTWGILLIFTIESPRLISISSANCITALCGAKTSSTSLPAISTEEMLFQYPVATLLLYHLFYKPADNFPHSRDNHAGPLFADEWQTVPGILELWDWYRYPVLLFQKFKQWFSAYTM
jgi:hypothetical protein